MPGSLENVSGNIGNIAARSLVKLGKRNDFAPFEVIDAGMAYPACYALAPSPSRYC